MSGVWKTESIQRIRQAYISHERILNHRYQLADGHYQAAMPGDGLEVIAMLPGKTRLGVYGGLRPDPAFYSPTTDYQAVGTYASYRQDGLNADLGYNLVFAGELDRQFLYSRVHYRAAQRLYLSTYLADCRQ